MPHWPRLREDLTLYRAAPAPDGSPTWHLSDPPANRFYAIGWAAFEILSRWQLADPDAIVEAVRRDTTLEIDRDDVDAMAAFLDAHFLSEAGSAEGSARLLAARQAQRLHWLRWLVRNYLFVRVPLVRPAPFLDRWAGTMALLFRPRFWFGAGLLALLSLGLVARQWDSFMHGFAAYQGWQMLVSFGLALSGAKVIHELGHAFAARHHGCKVPSMGVAFLVMWPVLYTDTTDAWKLPSRRARMQIGIAGIAAELLLAVAATLAWVVLPDGGLRASMFFLATTSWLVTLAINISPFMRFDGYFLLADLVNMPNLHARAFAFGRWWLRERLFGFGFAQPEPASRLRGAALVAFALGVWCYRLAVYLGIAFLVYHAFFKLLGIALLVVELGWFIVLPFLKEFDVWWKLRESMRWNAQARRSAAVLAGLLLLLVLPWQTRLSAPAVLAPAREQRVTAAVAAHIDRLVPAAQAQVKAGQTLAVLQSPELDYRIRLARVAEANWRLKAEQQSFSADLMGQGAALRQHWQEAAAQLDGLLQEQARLTMVAPFDATVLARNDELSAGSWVAPRELLFAIGDLRQSVVDVFVGEDDLGRLKVGGAASFLPEAPEYGKRACRIALIEPFTLPRLEEAALASVYGGAVNVRSDGHGNLLPVTSLYRVRLDQCLPAQAPLLRIRGTAHLEADGQSMLLDYARRLWRLLLREAGF